MHPALLVALIWFALNLGFVVGCWWASRDRRDPVSRYDDWLQFDNTRDFKKHLSVLPDVPPLSPARRAHIWQRIKDRIAVERLIGSL